jgi:hypothetical protein
MAWHLGGDIVANKLVDVPVGCSEVLPYFAGGTLWLRIDELDSSGKQSTLCGREVVDLKGDHRTFSEELVVFVLWTIDMDFGPVLQLEPSGRVIDAQNFQAQYVSIELVHSVELLSLCAHPAKVSYFHFETRKVRYVA